MVIELLCEIFSFKNCRKRLSHTFTLYLPCFNSGLKSKQNKSRICSFISYQVLYEKKFDVMQTILTCFVGKKTHKFEHLSLILQSHLSTSVRRCHLRFNLHDFFLLTDRLVFNATIGIIDHLFGGQFIIGQYARMYRENFRQENQQSKSIEIGVDM